MNMGEWSAILQFLEEKNDSGRYSACSCSQCNGSYVKHRAYVNQDGDFVLSQDTLTELLSSYSNTKLFSTSGTEKDWGYFYAKYRYKCKETGWSEEDRRVMSALIKKEYEGEE